MLDQPAEDIRDSVLTAGSVGGEFVQDPAEPRRREAGVARIDLLDRALAGGGAGLLDDHCEAILIVTDDSTVTRRVVEEDATSTALKQRDDKIAKLSKDLADWQARLPPLIERFRVRNEEADQLQHDLVTAQNQIAALEAMVSAEQTRVEPADSAALGNDLAASNDPIDVVIVHEQPETMLQAQSMLESETAEDDFSDDIQDDDSGNDTEDDELSANTQDDHAGDDTRDGAARDNLKMIKGVGPAIEKTLNEMGICRFVQIADMSEYDIDRVAHRLKGFRSRIYREDWIGQARDLQVQKLSGQA